MALSLGEIDSWDTGALEEFSHQLGRRSRTLEGLGTSVQDAAKIPGWMGQGADAAHVSFSRLSSEISDRAATVGAITELVTSLIDQVKALKRALDDARDHAARFGLVITDDGAVIDGPGTGTAEAVAGALGGPAAAAAAKAAKEAARAEITAQVQAILATAADVEADTTAILTKAAEGGFTGDGMSVEDASEKGQIEADGMFAAPPPPSTPAGQRAWAESLSPDQLGEAADNYPAELANAYQIAPWARERAAWNYLPKLRDELTSQAALLEEQHGAAQMMHEKTRAWTDLQTVRQKLRDLDQIETSVKGSEGLHLLGLRPHENGVGAVVAQGDIAAADHVAVHVPGMGTETADKLDSGGDLPGEIEKIERLQLAMDDSLEYAGRRGERVAAVAYMNMDYPDFLPQARTPDYADAAAPDLAGMLNGIKSTAAGETNLTLLGHSYGSLTSSEALQAGGRADNVVFYGSPGLESSGEEFDPASTGVPDGNRYIMLAKGDPIAPGGYFSPFGGPPADTPGLTRLDTNSHKVIIDGDEVRLGASSGHSEYDGYRTTSQWNMAAIATGAPENAIAYESDLQYRGRSFHHSIGDDLRGVR